MPDTKITALTAISTVNPATYPLPIVDTADTTMAASGTTKKITVNQILGSGGTATLASATITGDLTVKTNVMRVDTTNNRVGVLTASPSAALHVNGVDTTNVLFNGLTKGIRFVATASTSQITGVDNTGAASYQPLSIGGSALDFSLSGSPAMTLNSTGLGVGTSPSYKLDVLGSATISGRFRTSGALNALYFEDGGTTPGSLYIGTSGDTFRIITGSNVRMNVDVNGNVGIGVTPSAWAAGYKVIQGQIGGFALSNDNSSNNQFRLSSNAYFDTTDNRWEYYGTSTATAYEQRAGEHRFFNAPSGTLNTAITFTQAMTLSATGQLLLGTSSTNGGVDIGMVMNKPSATGFVGNVYQLNGVDKAFAYIASAASAYTTETVSGYIIRAVSATNGVYLANGGTSWLALSDERFKDIIEPISNAVAKICSLRSVIGKFKTESEGTRRPFLIAQDVQAVLPEAVDATKPDQLGVSYSDVIPLLVAAIKELTARVQTLETR